MNALAEIRLIEAAPIDVRAVNVKFRKTVEHLSPVVLSLTERGVASGNIVRAIEVALGNGDECGGRSDFDEMPVALCDHGLQCIGKAHSLTLMRAPVFCID